MTHIAKLFKQNATKIGHASQTRASGVLFGCSGSRALCLLHLPKLPPTTLLNVRGYWKGVVLYAVRQFYLFALTIYKKF